jgi:hypothetical protein
MKPSRTTSYCLFFVAALIGLSGCEQEGPAERAGENIDEAVEEVQQEAEHAGDQAMEKLEEATDELEEKADEAAD